MAEDIFLDYARKIQIEKYQIKASEIERGKWLYVHCVVNRGFEHHSCESPDLARFHQNFEEEHARDDRGPLTSLPLSTTSQEDLWLDGSLVYTHATKRHMSMLFFPGFEPLAQLHNSQCHESP
ncbi:hypothetical protein TNCV_1609461 [Trichonephila clavipes]|nr:hypothetical protein TNCV_1609461 [Trichonephila clavipes]